MRSFILGVLVVFAVTIGTYYLTPDDTPELSDVQLYQLHTNQEVYQGMEMAINIMNTGNEYLKGYTDKDKFEREVQKNMPVIRDHFEKAKGFYLIPEEVREEHVKFGRDLDKLYESLQLLEIASKQDTELQHDFAGKLQLYADNIVHVSDNWLELDAKWNTIQQQTASN